MYVCVCNGITTRDIEACVADGARTLSDLKERLGIATGCGQCAQCAEELLPACCERCECMKCLARNVSVTA